MGNFKFIVFLVALVAHGSFASIHAFDSNGLSIGQFSEMKCSTGMTCAQTSGKLTITSSPSLVDSFTFENDEVMNNTLDDTIEMLSNDENMIMQVLGFEAKTAALNLWADQGDDATDKASIVMGTDGILLFKNSTNTLMSIESGGDVVHSGTTPSVTIGDAGAEDSSLIFDGNAQDFAIGLDDTNDKLSISLGSTLGTTNRMAFNSADLNIVLGDASAADVGLIFDGNAQDYHMSLDDSTDDLVIGLGSAAGTTDAIRIDENQDVTIVQNLVGLGADTLSGFKQKQVTATATTITAAQCGSTFVSAGAIEIELPEASTVLGCRLTFIVGDASAYTIDPDAADQIALLTDAAGDSLIADAVGESLVIEAISASIWAPVGAEKGTWTDSN